MPRVLMENAIEMHSAIKNIVYYSQKVHELAHGQFNIDFDNKDMHQEGAEARALALENIGAYNTRIQFLCGRIELELAEAEMVDLQIDINKVIDKSLAGGS